MIDDPARPHSPSTDELAHMVLSNAPRPGALARAIDLLCDAVRRVILITVHVAQLVARVRAPPVVSAMMKPQDKEPLIDAHQLATLVGWSEATVYRKAKLGEIPSVLIGPRSRRFRFSDVERVLRE